VDNALYANVSASPAAATTKGRINEPICTSINDFMLVGNAIYTVSQKCHNFVSLCP